MLQHLRITPRLILVLVVQAIALIAIGWIAARGLLLAGDAAQRVDANLREQIALSEMAQVLRVEVPATLDDVLAARMTWEQGRSDVRAMKNLLASQWDEYRRDMTPDAATALETSLAPSLRNVNLAFAELDRLLSEPDTTRLSAWRHANLGSLTTPFAKALEEGVAQQLLQYGDEFKQATTTHAWALYGGLAALVLALVVVGMTGRKLVVSITTPLRAVENAVHQAVAGNYDVRIGIRGRDELSALAGDIDLILYERSVLLQQSTETHDQLHTSLAMLLSTVGELAARDYTARAPAADDATAPLANAINQLADDTGRILTNIRRITDQIAKTAVAAHAHTDVMIAVAENEQNRIDAISTAIAGTKQPMQVCETVLQETASATQGALQLVGDTATCLSDVHMTLHDTHNHAKRLGDEAQELGRVVTAFNAIAERAHIISVNASMQALTGGEGGRNVATTAAEMKHLAENIRDASRHVGLLMAKLQRDTGDHAALIDSAITQITASAQVAGHAGEHLRQTHQHVVEHAATLRASATNDGNPVDAQIKASLNATRAHLAEQRRHTQRLTHFARGLQTAVQSFSVPAERATDAEHTQNENNTAPAALPQQLAS